MLFPHFNMYGWNPYHLIIRWFRRYDIKLGPWSQELKVALIKTWTCNKLILIYHVCVSADAYTCIWMNTWCMLCCVLCTGFWGVFPIKINCKDRIIFQELLTLWKVDNIEVHARKQFKNEENLSSRWCNWPWIKEVPFAFFTSML